MPYRQKTNIQLFQIATVLLSSALRAVLSHLRRNKIRIEYVQSFQQTSGFIPRARIKPPTNQIEIISEAQPGTVS